jgi:hypothetical protein
MNVKALAIILTLLSSLIYENAFAENIIPCDSSCAGPFSKARQSIASYSNGDVFSIIDLNDMTAYSYRVESYRRGGEVIERAVQITTTANALNQLGSLKYALDQIELEKYSIPRDLPDTPWDDGLGSAADFIQDRNAQGFISEYINNNLTLVDRIGVYGSVLAAIFKKIIEINATITVEFEDGSKMQMVLVALPEEGIELEYIENSAEDSEGTKIPDSLDDFKGIFRFANNRDFEGFLGVADYFDVIVSTRQQCSPVSTVTCIVDTDGTGSCSLSFSCQ